MGSAVLEVVKALSQLPVNESLGSKGDLAALDARLKQIPNVHTYPLADALRYHDLEFGFYRNDVHRRPLIEFNR